MRERAYLLIVERARAALDPEDELAHRALERLLGPDVRGAIAAFDEVGFLAEDDPTAARANPVAAHAIRSARKAARLLRP